MSDKLLSSAALYAGGFLICIYRCYPRFQKSVSDLTADIMGELTLSLSMTIDHVNRPK